MKKAIALIAALLVALTAAAVALVTCEAKSQNIKLAEKAMDMGNYERAKRLYTFAIERGEAGEEDERALSIINAYIDASACLKSEDFAAGLEILDDCIYDYSSLAIRDDMDKLYSKLTSGKYADERIKALSGVVNAGDYERARTMVQEISQLTLTDAQQDSLYSITRQMTGAEEDIPISRPDGEDDEKDKEDDEDSGDDDSKDKDSDGDKNEGSGSDDKDGGSSGDEEHKDVPVEAVSDGDSLFVLTGVNLRPEPTTDSEVIDVVPAGAEVTYLGEMEHGFYKIEYNGRVGYVYSDYVRQNN